MYKIAIIDDETDILEFLSRFFSRKYEVTTFKNPLNAIEEIKENNYDLVLCDIMMPQLNGLDLLKKLQNENNNTKFIIMTAYDTLDKALESHKYGALNYIKKPFESLKELDESITTALNRQ